MFYFKHDTDLSLAFFKLQMCLCKTENSNALLYPHLPLTYDSDVMYSLLNTIILFEHHFAILLIQLIALTLTDGIIGQWDKWTQRLNVWNKGAKLKTLQ